MKADYYTQRELRAAFYAAHPHLKPKRGKKPSCDARQAFCFFIDGLARDNRITESLAFRATLTK